MLKLLETRYSTKLEKIEPIRPTADDFSSWSDSFTKLYAFKLVQYDRIVYLDADSVIRKHMDELFLLPPALIAAPLNYIDYRKIYKPTIWDDLGILDKLDDIPPTPFEYELITQDLYHSIIENELEFNDHYFWSLYAALQAQRTRRQTPDAHKKARHADTRQAHFHCQRTVTAAAYPADFW